MRACGRGQNTQPVWIHREALHHSGLQETHWPGHPRYALRDPLPRQRLASVISPRRKRVDRSERGRTWLQLCCCARVTTHRPLLTASSKAIIKFLVEKEEEEKKVIMSSGQVSQQKSNRDQTSLRLSEEFGFEIHGWGPPLIQTFHCSSYKVEHFNMILLQRLSKGTLHFTQEEALPLAFSQTWRYCLWSAPSFASIQ